MGGGRLSSSSDSYHNYVNKHRHSVNRESLTISLRATRRRMRTSKQQSYVDGDERAVRSLRRASSFLVAGVEVFNEHRSCTRATGQLPRAQIGEAKKRNDARIASHVGRNGPARKHSFLRRSRVWRSTSRLVDENERRHLLYFLKSECRLQGGKPGTCTTFQRRVPSDATSVARGRATTMALPTVRAST